MLDLGNFIAGPFAATVRRSRPAVNPRVAMWTASLTRDEALEICRAAHVPVGPVHSIAEMFDDPQYVHRETIVTVDSRIGPLAVPGAIPVLSDTPDGISWLGPQLGVDTDEVLAELLCRTADEIAALSERGVV